MDIAFRLVHGIWFLASLVGWPGSAGPPSVDKLWKAGNCKRDSVLEHSYLTNDYFLQEREMVRAMEADSIRLRERFRQDAAKLRQIAQDWYDYASAVSEVKRCRELLNGDRTAGAFERFLDKTRDNHLAIHEIGRRVIDELGEQSHLKSVLDEIEGEDPADSPFDERMRRIEARRRDSHR